MAENPSLVPGPPTTTRTLLGFPEIAALTTLVAGAAGIDRVLSHPRIQKSGLALAGHMHGIVPSRVQILGETELSYLASLDPAAQVARAASLFANELSIVMITRGVDPPAYLLDAAERSSTPLVVSSRRSSGTITAVHDALDRLLAPRTRMHGVLVEVHGLGILLTGPSGIGKSECALFVVERGHRFIADDAVDLVRMAGDGIVGSAPPPLRHHLEIRGLGVLNVRDLFGATAVRDSVQVDLVVELTRLAEGDDEDRLGLEDRTRPVLGIPIPLLKVPVRPGRDMGVLLEVAARNQLLKRSGLHGARAFLEKLTGEKV
jgi:HPr kinase/phosphorylase